MRRAFILSILTYSVLVPPGLVGGMYLDFAIAEMIYPDPCVYHTREAPTNIFFTAFFDYDGGTGFHPEPSLFSIIFYAVMGGAVSIVVSCRLNRYFRSMRAS